MTMALYSGSAITHIIQPLVYTLPFCPLISGQYCLLFILSDAEVLELFKTDKRRSNFCSHLIKDLSERLRNSAVALDQQKKFISINILNVYDLKIHVSAMLFCFQVLFLIIKNFSGSRK